MLRPPPTSRQASYDYSLPGQSSAQDPLFRHTTDTPLNSPSAATSATGEDCLDDATDFENSLELEEGWDGLEKERGLEATLEKIGFGAYHYRLLALCGFGWMSDNSALQSIAIILPRVQIHFDLTPQIMGLFGASAMTGMMIGAVGWGTVSDLLGRALPFNSTLFLTAVFGIGASFAPTFPILCMWMFLLGTAVGGSMPTDGTLFLENLPSSKQYLLTLLSLFFSLGAVLSSAISYFFLPGASCRQFTGCDIDGKENDGWRRVLLVLGSVNLLCAFARWGLFRLHESPRYLVSTGRQQEAVMVLRQIAQFNDQSLDIQHIDVQDTAHVGEDTSVGVSRTSKASAALNSVPEPSALQLGEGSPLPRYFDVSEGAQIISRPRFASQYDSVGMGPPAPPRKLPLGLNSTFSTAPTATEQENTSATAFPLDPDMITRVSEEEQDGLLASDKTGSLSRQASQRSLRRNSSGPLSWWVKWSDQIAKLFVPQWRRTVVLMWIIWGSMSFAYNMFNVWLPTVLETRAGEGDEVIREALKQFLLYSMAGCPGSVIGAWMIQTRLGRRKSLAICTLGTSLAMFAFITVQASWALTLSSMLICMAATAMYAVLYGMTPEIFGSDIRGTACGTSAALSRFTGIFAPVSAGFLLAKSQSLPVLAAAAILMVTAACSLALPFERVAEKRATGAVMPH